MHVALLGLYLVWMVVINLCTAYSYAHDKRAAIRHQWRTPERILYRLNLLGGVVGAWLVFFGLRHKTRHASFWLVQSLCTALHVAIAALVIGITISPGLPR